MYIQTERLELKPIYPESLDHLIQLITDGIVKKTYMLPDFSCPEEAINLATRLMEKSRHDDRLMAGIYAGSQLVGILNETESTGEYIELGYALLPRYHNQGYATEALRGAIGYCFSLGFPEVRTGAFQCNPASIRVMEKNGMTRIPFTEEIPYRGITHTSVYYAIRKENGHAVPCEE